MIKINKHLAEWLDNGLISLDQHDSILSYEHNKSKKDRSRWILYGFMILGICVLGIGIISLIAANWASIPPSAKLAGSFIILAAAAFASYRMYGGENEAASDALISLFSLLCLATIGLISQIFQTGGQPYQALILWLIIIFPLSAFSKKYFLPHMWAAGSILAYILWAFSETSWWYSLDSYFEQDIILSIILTVPFITIIISVLFKRISWLAAHSGVFTMWALISAIAAIGATDLYYSENYSNLFPKLLLPVYILMILSIFILVYFSDYSPKERGIIISIIILTIVVHLPNFMIAIIKIYEFGILIGALYSIILLVLIGMLLTIRNNKKLFNAVILLLGCRFLIIYFQVFSDLATTGFGLIISGILIILIASMWFRKHERIEQWFGDIVK
ncbi:MAG: DUF2157 domain-containing protein [Spirochaetes bacterium]|nr:DUF2157 domain-containing protein [Spirochaetota bacterium]